MTSLKSPDEPRFSVHYRVTVNGSSDIENLARDITIEQTAEAPIDCIPDRLFREGIIGRVESIIAVEGEAYAHDVVISYRCDLTVYTVPQLLNVVYCNISLKNNIKVIDLDFPGAFLDRFSGPSHGIDGIRKMLGVFGRPLACMPLKPMGLSIAELSSMAGALARGGVDLIKDDHGIGNQRFHPFRERVSHCQEAVYKENARSGRATMYCPMVSGGFDEIEDQVRHAVKEGVRGILIAPMLVGLDTVRYISTTYGIIIIGHPSLTGTFFSNQEHGMTPAVLLGTLFRLIGADISIFPGAGGRFFFTKKECGDLSRALLAPLGSIKRSFPCPAGGLSIEKMGDLAPEYGVETVFLIGGSLLRQSRDVSGSTELFMDRIRSLYAP